MKKKLYAIFGIVFALVIGIFTINIPQNVSYADSEDETTITAGTILTSDYFADMNLYHALVKVADRIKLENGETTGFNVLKAGDLSSVKVLDLTYEKMSITFTPAVGDDVVYNFYINPSPEDTEWVNHSIMTKLTSVFGLENLIFGTNFNELILDGHSLTEIEETLFANMSSLRSLSIQNNQLTAISIPASIPIQKLRLENNLLTEIDLNCLRQLGTDPAECHLENNNFAQVSNIVLPNAQTTKVSLYLAQNYLTDATKADFGGHNVSLLIQGIKKDVNITLLANTYIRVTADTAEENFVHGEQKITAKAFYRTDSSFYNADDVDSNLVATSDNEGKLILPAGKLVIKFYNDGVEYDTGNFVAKNIDIYPNAPTIKVKRNGEFLETIPASIKGDFRVVALSENSTGVMEIRFSTGSWTNGNYIDVKDNGSYIIYARVTVDGLVSDSAYLIIKNTNSTKIVWVLIILIGAVILIVGGLYLYRWFRAGGIVAPLTDKEIAREQYRKSKKDKNNK